MSLKIVKEQDKKETTNIKELSWGFIDSPLPYKSYEYVNIIDYRSLYPGPFELVLTKYDLDIITLQKYSSKYHLVKKILSSKIDDCEFKLIELEKNNLYIVLLWYNLWFII